MRLSISFIIFETIPKNGSLRRGVTSLISAKSNRQLYLSKGKKIKVRFSYIAPHLRIPPSAALSSQTESPFIVGGSRPSLHTQTCCHTATRSPSLLLLKVSTSIIHVNTWTATHLPTLEKWKDEVDWLANP